MTFRFLHAADLHLDSPLRGLDRYEGAPVEELRGATRRALENLVELAQAEEVDFVVVAGDVYDGDLKDFGTALFLSAQLRRLKVPVFLIQGNHDAASVVTKKLALPENVVRFPTRKPSTDKATLKHLNVAVHGQGFATREVVDDLAAGYPERVAGAFNIGVLHTSLTGREGHASYAPTSAGALATKGYDYWALGHVHEREVVSEEPWTVFPGNIQGRHARETGAKGASLVTVEDGEVVSVEHRELDVVRWGRVGVDVTGCDREEGLLARVRAAVGKEVARADGRMLAARVELAGDTELHDDLVTARDRWDAAVRDGCGPSVWVEKVRVATRAPGGGGGLPEEMEGLLDPREDDADIVREVLAEFGDKVPAELLPGAEGGLLEGARDLARAALARKGGGA